MEIPAWMFFSFWSLISITFLHLGLNALDKTQLSKSVSPVVMSIFKHCLAISSCSSSSHALIFRPQSTHEVLELYAWVAGAILSVLYYKVFAWSFLVGYIFWSVTFGCMVSWLEWLFDFLSKLKIFSNSYSPIIIFWCILFCILIITMLFLPTAPLPLAVVFLSLMNFVFIVKGKSLHNELQTRIGIHMAVETSMFFVSGKDTKFFPVLVLFLSFSISVLRAGFELLTPVSEHPSLGGKYFRDLVPVAEKVKEVFSSLKEKIIVKLIGYGVGMLGTVIFQYFFRLTSFNHVVAFLYLALMWVANLTLLGVSGDFGVLNFLLGNVVVGCTVNQFGLRGTTWFAYGTCLLLYGLRLKLESLNLVYGGGEHVHVTLWFYSSHSLLPTYNSN